MKETMNAGDIKELRNSTGLTQEEFAHKIGATHDTVRRWEGGAKPMPVFMAALLRMRRLENRKRIADG